MSDQAPQSSPAGSKAASSLVGQNFDAFQRMAVILRVCEALAARGCSTVADVGGHPGLLMSHLPPGLRCRAIVDIPACRRADYVCGTALRLPLRDACVDIAVCADTLEHVPDALQAVRELTRVARRAVVISAPWKSAASDHVETLLDRWHRQITGCAHPWLSEHREIGLPVRTEVTDLLRSEGWGLADLFCGGLAEWTLLQIAMLLADLVPPENMRFSEFNREYNANWPIALSTRLPAQPYRTVLVAARDPALAAEIEALASGPVPGPPLTRALVLVDGLITAVQEALMQAHSRPESFDAEYRERLEALTSQQAQEIDLLRQEVDRLRGATGLTGLAKRAKSKLLGREPRR